MSLVSSMPPQKKSYSYGEEAAPATDIIQQSQLVVIHYFRLLSDELCCICSSMAASCHMPSDWVNIHFVLKLKQAGFLHPCESAGLSALQQKIAHFFGENGTNPPHWLKSCFCSLLNESGARLKVMSCPNGFYFMCVKLVEIPLIVFITYYRQFTLNVTYWSKISPCTIFL